MSYIVIYYNIFYIIVHQGVVMNEEGEMVEDFPTTGKEAWKVSTRLQCIYDTLINHIQ